MYCEKCKIQIPDEEDTRFCPECGMPLKESGTEADGEDRGKGRKVRTFQAVLTAAALLSLASLGVRGFQHVREYGFLDLGAVTEEALSEQRDKREQLRVQADAVQSELMEAVERRGRYEQNLQDADTRVREIYGDMENAAAEAISLVWEELGNAESVYYETEDFSDTMKDEVIDTVAGNPIVASGIKSALESASEDLSVESILSGASDGILAGVQDFAEGKAKDYISDAIGVDVFSIGDTEQELISIGDTPKVLANYIAEDADASAQRLQGFLASNQISEKEVRILAEDYYRLKMAQKDMALIKKEDPDMDTEGKYQHFLDMARVFARSQYLISQYSEADAGE